jgi:preprotein translocase subunit YajC
MAAQTSANPLIQLFPFFMMFLIFYLLVLRPQKREQDAHKKKLSALQKNDRVITAGGIHGTIINVKESTVIIRVDDNAKLEIDKDSIKVVKA